MKNVCLLQFLVCIIMIKHTQNSNGLHGSQQIKRNTLSWEQSLWQSLMSIQMHPCHCSLAGGELAFNQSALPRWASSRFAVHHRVISLSLSFSVHWLLYSSEQRLPNWGATLSPSGACLQRCLNTPASSANLSANFNPITSVWTRCHPEFRESELAAKLLFFFIPT